MGVCDFLRLLHAKFLSKTVFLPVRFLCVMLFLSAVAGLLHFPTGPVIACEAQ